MSPVFRGSVYWGICVTIHLLPENVAAQIAAGEVVERPASVIKELIENSLDAGATYIHTHVLGGGRQMMRVSDNGQGIHAEEVDLAFARHATSKLETVADLDHIETLGFRGEALASISSVSHVTLVTRVQQETAGTEIVLHGGTLVQRRSVGTPSGTVITVEHLFYNTPARLKFLKSENTEKRQIATIITRYAMAYPHVRFVIEQDGREVFRSHGNGNLADVMISALGLDSVKEMVEVFNQEEQHDDRPALTVSGFTSTPNLNRADRSRICLFVNGRWVQDTSLTYAVVQAYHTLLMNDRYPISVILVQLSPTEVDVNVHPTKAEVRFRNANAVFSGVQRSVRRAVIDLARTPLVQRSHFSGVGDQRETVWGTEEGGDGNYTISPYPVQKQMHMGLPLDHPGVHPLHRASQTGQDYANSTDIPIGPGAPQKPRTLPLLRVVGQVGASYIVAEGPNGLYLIDQHAAHERILYEQFMETHAHQEQASQFALTSQTIDLAAPEARLIDDNLVLLQSVGFHLESFGPNTFVIRAVPSMLADKDPVEAVIGILADLERGHHPGQETIEDKIVKRVCKQAAIKAGQTLSFEEMQKIIRQLERCASPHTCPHGRPTMLHMTGEQLAREFGRI